MDEANQRGVQELDSKGLIDIVEEIKNGDPRSMYKDFRHRYNDVMSVPRRKTQD